MGNYDLKYPKKCPEKGGIRALRTATAASVTEAIQFQIAQTRAEEQRIAEKEEKNALQSKYPDSEITDSFFVENEEGVNTFPNSLYQTILNIMCVYVTDDVESKSTAQLLIEEKLKFSGKHKDIQVLENFGIKKYYLDDFIVSCGIDPESMDFDPINIVIFMLKNGFFSKKEVLDNLALVEPIQFYNPDVIIDIDENKPGSGFSAKSKSKLANVPEEIKSQAPDAIVEYVIKRLERLKMAVREDYFNRLNKLNYSLNRSLKLKPKED